VLEVAGTKAIVQVSGVHGMLAEWVNEWTHKVPTLS
jgi:hypothetical protein